MDTLSKREIFYSKSKKSYTYRSFTEQVKTHKGSYIIYTILRLLIFGIMITQLIDKDYHNVFICILTSGLLVLPSFFEIKWEIRLPSTFQNMLLFYIFCAEILGEVLEFYVLFPWWDIALHAFNGFWVAAIGYSFAVIMNKDDKTTYKISPKLVVIIAFCFSMTIGVFWEFFEFSVDTMFISDMQKDTVVKSISSVMLDPAGGNKAISVNNITNVIVNGQELGFDGYLDIGLIDTMKDLLINLIGAVVFSVLCYIHLKSDSKWNFISNFIILKNKKYDGKYDGIYSNI